MRGEEEVAAERGEVAAAGEVERVGGGGGGGRWR